MNRRDSCVLNVIFSLGVERGSNLITSMNHSTILSSTTLLARSACLMGVHKGHRYLLECARETARKDNGKSIALTFDIDPDELFHADRLKKLMSNEQRIEMLARSGVDAVAVLHFTREFAALSPLDFLNQTFKGFVPAHLHVGLDFHFGAKAAGSVADLGEWAARNICHIDAHNLQSKMACLSPLRAFVTCLLEHDLVEAERLLGRPFPSLMKCSLDAAKAWTWVSAPRTLSCRRTGRRFLRACMVAMLM